jgi:hypothetical protein
MRRASQTSFAGMLGATRSNTLFASADFHCCSRQQACREPGLAGPRSRSVSAAVFFERLRPDAAQAASADRGSE